MIERNESFIIVRGGGDLASGVIHTLVHCGFSVLVLETLHPSSIRRQVSFSEAVYNGSQTVEGITCRRCNTLIEAERIRKQGEVPLMIDETAKIIKERKPDSLVDAIMAKKNLGTNRAMAKRTIALGPGFVAGVDVDYVIETMRGHNLGRILSNGSALPNTGIPGVIKGYGEERVLHAPTDGTFIEYQKIGSVVKKGEAIAFIKTSQQMVPVTATLDGIIRGMIRDEYPVTKGFKIADLDPRIEELSNCFTISDKARCIAGAVLEAILLPE